MNWVNIIESASKLLTEHAKSIILIGSLLLTGILIYGFSLVGSTPETATITFLWMYFAAMVVSFGLIIAVLYLAHRT
jgi:hypothetical protein